MARKGFGKKLLEKALAVSKELEKEFMWLGVWDQNPKAIEFYQSQGMIICGKHTFDFAGDPQSDYVMKINI